MKTLYAITLVLLATASYKAKAQHAPDNTRTDVAVGYNYIHSNAPPSGCGCFNWNGGSISANYHFKPKWGTVAEFGGAHAGPIGNSTISPTMTTYLFGPRYTIATRSNRVAPFGNILLGAAHATNGYFPNGTNSSSSATSFAMTAGGGIDFPVGRHVSIRAVEAEYLLTLFPNAVNDRQNNFRLTAGVVFRFAGR